MVAAFIEKQFVFFMYILTQGLFSKERVATELVVGNLKQYGTQMIFIWLNFLDQ